MWLVKIVPKKDLLHVGWDVKPYQLTYCLHKECKQ